MNALDAVFGVFFQHADTLQRYTQYETDLIVIAVAKKQLKFGYGMDEEEEDEGTDEGSDEGSDEDEKVEDPATEEGAEEK